MYVFKERYDKRSGLRCMVSEKILEKYVLDKKCVEKKSIYATKNHKHRYSFVLKLDI